MKDLSYQTFGKLFVLYPTAKNKQGNWKWWCHCECGNFKEAVSSCLVRGETTSCGCVMLERTREANTTHGCTETHLYMAWSSMRQRCFNPKHKFYHRYGGRGIKVCEDWSDFLAFKSWAESNGYTDGLSIDRIDNNGDYCASNCEWVTRSENSKRRHV